MPSSSSTSPGASTSCRGSWACAGQANCRFWSTQTAGVSLYGSAAILLHLAEISGAFLPPDGPGRVRTLERFFFCADDLGEAFNRWLAFEHVLPERDETALDLFARDISRYGSVLDSYLAQSPFVAGGDYSIADMAAYPYFGENLRDDQRCRDLSNVARWVDLVAARTATRRAYTRLPPAF